MDLSIDTFKKFQEQYRQDLDSFLSQAANATRHYNTEVKKIALHIAERNGIKKSDLFTVRGSIVWRVSEIYLKTDGISGAEFFDESHIMIVAFSITSDKWRSFPLADVIKGKKEPK